jgi:hypothetical protein
MTSLDELEKNFELIFLAEVLLQNVHVNDWSNICYPILKQANSNSKTRLDDEEFSEFYRQILEKTPLTKKNSDFTDKPDKIDIETLKNESSVKLQELLETNFPRNGLPEATEIAHSITNQLFHLLGGALIILMVPDSKSWSTINLDSGKFVSKSSCNFTELSFFSVSMSILSGLSVKSLFFFVRGVFSNICL